MKRIASRLVTLTVPVIALGADSVPKFEFSLPGDLREPSPIPTAGSGWFAIRKADAEFELVSTSIDLQSAPDPCAGSYTRVVTAGVRDPIFLMRGSPHFRAGPLDTVFYGRRFFFPAEHDSFQLKAGAWFGFKAYGSAKPGQGGPSVTDYQIVLVQGSREQVIADFSAIDMDRPPTLRWAGDLDRDNKLDAIFNLSTHYASSSYVLFLSSDAEAGKLVRDVAKIHVPGC